MIAELVAAILAAVSGAAAPPSADPLEHALTYPDRLAAATEATRNFERSVPASDPAPEAEPGEVGPSPEAWAALRACESSGNYSTDTGNGYFGAYQFDLPTWATYGPPGNPAHAAPAEQDRRALALWRDRGSQPWPVCGRYLEE